MDPQTADAFYCQVGPARFAPTEATGSPWDQSLQHGGPPAALLLGAVEREHDSAGRIAAARPGRGADRPDLPAGNRIGRGGRPQRPASRA